MVPFNFRLLASEILQYSRKHNETIDRLLKILFTVQKVIIFHERFVLQMTSPKVILKHVPNILICV